MFHSWVSDVSADLRLSLNRSGVIVRYVGKRQSPQVRVGHHRPTDSDQGYPRQCAHPGVHLGFWWNLGDIHSLR